MKTGGQAFCFTCLMERNVRRRTNVLESRKRQRVGECDQGDDGRRDEG